MPGVEQPQRYLPDWKYCQVGNTGISADYAKVIGKATEIRHEKSCEEIGADCATGGPKSSRANYANGIGVGWRTKGKIRCGTVGRPSIL